MRRILTTSALLLGVLVLGWAGVGVAQQQGGAFLPGFNYAIPGFWNYTNVNTSSLYPEPFRVGGLTASGVVSKVVTLTNAQVLTLGSAPVTVLTAPGINKFLDVLGVVVFFDYTAAYTGGANLRLYYSSRASGAAASESITASGLLVSVSADTIARVGGAASNSGGDYVNTAVVLATQTAVDFAAGDASNAVRVVINYRIVCTTGSTC